jgi:hypothetical protein
VTASTGSTLLHEQTGHTVTSFTAFSGDRWTLSQITSWLAKKDYTGMSEIFHISCIFHNLNHAVTRPEPEHYMFKPAQPRAVVQSGRLSNSSTYETLL